MAKNRMAVSIAEYSGGLYTYELFLIQDNDSVHVRVQSVKQICELARMMGMSEIVVESNSTLRYNVNGTDLSAHIETEIALQGANRRGRKYNPAMIVTAVIPELHK